MRQLISGDEAVECKTQPITPCSDCPFARTALKGWLGNMDIDEWLQALHGEAKIDCHALIGPQCAGAAIYRANVCKLTHDQNILRLAPDKKLCFATPKEFREHHSKMNVDALVQTLERKTDIDCHTLIGEIAYGIRSNTRLENSGSKGPK